MRRPHLSDQTLPELASRRQQTTQVQGSLTQAKRNPATIHAETIRSAAAATASADDCATQIACCRSSHVQTHIAQSQRLVRWGVASVVVSSGAHPITTATSRAHETQSRPCRAPANAWSTLATHRVWIQQRVAQNWESLNWTWSAQSGSFNTVLQLPCCEEGSSSQGGESFAHTAACEDGVRFWFCCTR